MNRSAFRAVAPLVMTLSAGAVLLATFGANPFAFYADVFRFGLADNSWQSSVTLFTPLILMALGLLVSFRAGLWNLGYDGQFIISAVVVAGLGPTIFAVFPFWVATILLIFLGAIAGMIWALAPILIKIRNNASEIVTTLVMSFIGIGIANLLVRYVFQDPSVLVPQTRVIANEFLLPYLPGTRVHVGIIFALILYALGYLLLTKTSVGVRLDVLAAGLKTAKHLGINTSLALLLVFLISGGLVGVAASVDVLGVWGYVRTDFNPAYGIAVIPLVLMAGRNPLLALPLIGFYSIFATGTTVAAGNAGIAVDLILVLISLLLGSVAITEWMLKRGFRWLKS